MGRASQAKGARFEREVCRKLSGWVSGDARDDLFWRSSMSGGRATVGAKQGITRALQAGDISAMGGEGVHADRAASFVDLVLIECKALASYRLDRFVLGFKGPIADAWKQAMIAIGDDYRRVPFIVLRENRGKTIVVTDARVYEKLNRNNSECISYVYVIRRASPHKVIVMEFDDFLRKTSILNRTKLKRSIR